VTDVLERIDAFERDLERRLSTRTEPCRFGTAYFHDAFPVRWDSNFVWTDPPLDGVEAEELAADADDVLGRAGLRHRVIWVADVVQGERLAPGLARLGYRVDRNVVMVHAREPDRWTDDRAEELDLESAKAMWFVSHLEDPDHHNTVDVAQRLADFLEVLVENAGCRFFGVRVDGDAVAGAQLMVIDGVAQVEDVVTLTAHRGQGFARAAVLAAVRAARDAGGDLVYLGADDEDWPKHMYAKLGFDEAGRSYDFVKEPPAQRA
jgi:ribosomal protein S18 acetylase RimI-like enzyme